MPTKARTARGDNADVKRVIVIPIMGQTGAGKSTFINALLGEDRMRVSDGLEPGTRKLEIATIDSFSSHPAFRDYKLVIVETPGFNDSFAEDTEILRSTAEWLEKSYRNQHVLGGIVYLHNISLTRFDGTARRNLEMFQSLCGNAALNKVVLGTTLWTRVPTEIGRKYEAEMSQKYWASLIRNGSVVRQFQDSRKSAWSIINNILDCKRVDNVLQIQKELVDELKSIPETEAGKKLRYTLQEVLEMQKATAGLEKEFAKEGGQEAKAKLRETEEKMEQLLKQIEELKIPLSRRILRFFRF